MIDITDNMPTGLAKYDLAAREPEARNDELGQDEFLTLLIAQIKHQDPMKPMENGAFIAEMAQFSTVSGIEEMNDSLQELSGAYGAGQTLQASSLIGREVLVDDATLVLGEGEADGAGGRFELEASSGEVTLEILDPSGALVRRLPLGQHAAGTHDFRWDGLDDDGEPVPPGRYSASVTAANGGEEPPTALTVMVARTVDSVEFAPGGRVQLNTDTGEAIELDEVRQISERAQSD